MKHWTGIEVDIIHLHLDYKARDKIITWVMQYLVGESDGSRIRIVRL